MRKIDKKYIIINLFSLFIILTCVIKIGSIYFNSKKNEKIKKESQKIEKSKHNKQAMVEGKDGWYYYLESNRHEKEVGLYDYNYYLTGCNLKYITIDDNYATFTDETGTHPIYMTPPMLETSFKSKDKSTLEKDELKKINNLLIEKKWNKKINDLDLKDFMFVNFSPKLVIELWNKLYDIDYTREYGKYSNLPTCNIIFDENKLERENAVNYFQIGIYNNYGVLEKIRIDYVDENGKYLTDKILSGNATQTEKKMLEKLKKIEESILDSQSFELGSEFNSLKNDKVYSELFDLIKIFRSNN